MNDHPVSELEQTQAELKQTQLQMAALLEELEQFYAQNSRMEQELLISQANKQQTEADLQQTQSRLAQFESESHQIKSQLYQAQNEARRLNYLQDVATLAETEAEQKYRILIYEAWYAYQKNDLEQMMQFLRKSLRWSSFSLTQTVEHWLESLSEFSRQSGDNFEIRSLISSQQWKGLIQSIMQVSQNKVLSVT